jgi:serine/threonine protein kinase
MAVLYRVESPDYKIPLIMKVPRLALGDDPVAVVSYEVERMMLDALCGPHVPRLLDAGDISKPYLVMEFIDGPALSAWIDKAPLPPPQIASLIAPLATAVHYLHEQHVVHLDLKPSNVMYRHSNEVVLIDLGLAHHSHFPDLLAEEFRKPMGSAPYMAPEQVVGIRNDPRSDIFALGAIMYELATGVMPYGSPTSVAGLRLRIRDEPVPPRGRTAAVPHWLQEIILRCLEVDAAKRYASAAQIAFDLSHPDQVPLTERGQRLKRDGFLNRVRHRLWAVGFDPAPAAVPEISARSRIILVGVATEYEHPEQSTALREMVKRVAASNQDCRIAVTTVIRPHPMLGTSYVGDSGGQAHIRQMVELRHWASGLDVVSGRLSFHVLEDDDPAQALLDYARVNQVEQIVIGASPIKRGLERSPVLRPLLGSVASHVALEAPCSVTVVRPRSEDER